MSLPPVYTTLNIPTAISYPSISCLQWSSDGQACFTTKNAAYIMTPDHGIHFDATSAIKSMDERELRDGLPPIGWFRTIIQLDKTDVHRWPEHSQIWGAASLGSIDVSLASVVFSPGGLSPDAGCILACLTTNMDLTLWAATKNFLKGEWVKICDVTSSLIDALSADHDLGIEARTLQAQIVSMAWSQQPDFGRIPVPPVDASLLVAGNRAGSIVFFRYLTQISVERVSSVSVSQKWITYLAFSAWKTTENDVCESLLAYATADGAVGIVRVTQKLDAVLGIAQSGLKFNLILQVDTENAHQVHPPDKAGVTGLSWIETRNGLVLVYCKPGLVYLWSPFTSPVGSDARSGWTGTRSFRLQNRHISAGSSPFHPTSGIQYVPIIDTLVVSLFDGSLHLIRGISIDPSMEEPSPESNMGAQAQQQSGTQSGPIGGLPVTSQTVSETVRSIFTHVELGEMEHADVNRVMGFVSYDGTGTFLWPHESCRPSDFSYKHEAKHSSMLVVARLWQDVSDEALIGHLDQILQCSKTAARCSPLSVLRPFFFKLRDKSRLSRLHPAILQVLTPDRGVVAADHSLQIRLEAWKGPLTDEMRAEFRASLVRHLFGWDALFSLRMRLSLADFAWKLAANEQNRAECGVVAQDLLNGISYRTLRTLVRHLAAAVDVLTEDDVPFVLRMAVQSLLPGSPPDLSEEGQALSTMVHGVLLAHGHPDPVGVFNELCPACHVEVPLQDITSAVCSNGHVWARCSITTFILSTTFVRTCVGCSRKAYLPLSASTSARVGAGAAGLGDNRLLPGGARGWVVEELLEAVQKCLFCNDSFVQVL